MIHVTLKCNHRDVKYSFNLLIYHYIKLPNSHLHYQECVNTRHKRYEKYDTLFLVNSVCIFSMRNQIFMNPNRRNGA